MIDRPEPAGPEPAATASSGDSALESSVARLLTIGTYGAVALLAIGVILLLGSGLGPRSAEPAFDPSRIAADLAGLAPAGFIWLGLLVVMATPSARVGLALIGYARRGERVMAVVAALILLVIAASVVVARLAEG